MNKRQWDNKDILYWAIKYLIVPDRSLVDIEHEMNVSHSTTWWCFNNRLKRIDNDLFEKVQRKLKRDHKEYVYRK